MADFALSRLAGPDLPVTIACLGLLYCKVARGVGQDMKGKDKLNLTDLSLLPLTPIMGSGRAPLQPLEVTDAARRIAHLALSDPALRPAQLGEMSPKLEQMKRLSSAHLRIYDAVGPETITYIDLLRKFAQYQQKKSFRPVFVDYRNLELILNVKSLGNLNRQFVSLLRSEQEGDSPIIGNPAVFNALIPDEPLLTLDEAMGKNPVKRGFPYLKTLRWAFNNPKVIPHGAMLGLEIVQNAIFGTNKQDSEVCTLRTSATPSKLE